MFIVQRNEFRGVSRRTKLEIRKADKENESFAMVEMTQSIIYSCYFLANIDFGSPSTPSALFVFVTT